MLALTLTATDAMPSQCGSTHRNLDTERRVTSVLSAHGGAAVLSELVDQRIPSQYTYFMTESPGQRQPSAEPMFPECPLPWGSFVRAFGIQE